LRENSSCVNDPKQPWVGLGQLNDEKAFQEQATRELPAHSLADQVSKADEVDLRSNRRDFLKMMGFGLGAATAAAACDIPRKYAVPYVVKPDQIVPGVATYYASSFVSGNDFCPVLVKTREGRPIKIEGNSISKELGSGTTARAQASVLSLYDTTRVAGPAKLDADFDPNDNINMNPGLKLSWGELDELMRQALKPGARVRIVTNTIHSPSLKAAVGEFVSAHPGTKVVTYDASSSSAIVEANERSLGEAKVPVYHFDKADVVVGIDCDFLGTWLFPSLYNEQYAKRRQVVNQVRPSMNRHYQIESTMTMTGSNADHRVRVKPSHIGQAILELHNQVAGLTGGSSAGSARLDAETKTALEAAARDLVAARGSALVVSGSNNVAEQGLVNAINSMLGAYGSTIDAGRSTNLRAGKDRDMKALVAEMQQGRVDVVIFHGDTNPAFDWPEREQFVAALAKVPVRLSMAGTVNETAALCQLMAPDHHVLESWGDAEPLSGVYTLIQPTIHQLWNTRQAGQSLLTWANSDNLDTTSDQPFRDYLRAHWEQTTFPQQSRFASFDAFWDNCLNDGVLATTSAVATGSGGGGSFGASSSGIRKPGAEGELEVVFTEPVGIGNGSYANNPWLQEVPDPVTRTTWGNYLQVPVTYSGGRNYDVFQGLNSEELKGKTDIVELTANGVAAPVSCVVQFGMAPDTVGISPGYGRKVIGKAGYDVGTDVFPMMSLDADGNRQNYATGGVAVGEILETDERFAIVQYHHTMGVAGLDEGEAIMVDEERTLFGGYGGVADGYEGSLTQRSIIRSADVKELPEFIDHLQHEREHHQKLNSHSLYEGHEDAFTMGHHWGMYVDLNSCTGCSACVVACIAENNTPVVGKSEVARHHEMTWLRIDRYYYGDVDNPQVVYQPMMCQHCDNAPCENVCPVAATNHSSEGLNQMTYNRCIGTRYCANNCPYKVRRFNWMDYTTADIFIGNEPGLSEDAVVPVGGEIPFGSDNLTRMVLNPDVTVRSRGVIEKCSFCVQRLQEGKLTAKLEGRRLRDSDVKTACQTACPTGAITFGDRNNPNGELMEKWNAPVNYLVLEEVNVAPSVMYSAKISNRNATLAALDVHPHDDHHGENEAHH